MATVHVGRLLGPVGFARTVAVKRLHAQFAKDPEFVSRAPTSAPAAIVPDESWHVAVLDLTATSLQGTIDGERVALTLSGPDAGVAGPIVMRIGAPYTELVTAPVRLAFDNVAVSTLP